LDHRACQILVAVCVFYVRGDVRSVNGG
jgi:hypothetical protein